MAPVSAAERQHKRTERLKAARTYDDYKYEMLIIVGLIELKKAKEFENLKTEDKEKLLKENHAKANKRQMSAEKEIKTKLLFFLQTNQGTHSIKD